MSPVPARRAKTESSDATMVVAHVSGSFPGSALELRLLFQFAGVAVADQVDEVIAT
jgi:hypothetical protein